MNYEDMLSKQNKSKTDLDYQPSQTGIFIVAHKVSVPTIVKTFSVK